MQVTADWTSLWTVAKIEEELAPFEFKGPGFYLSSTDTLLIVPVEERSEPWTNVPGAVYRVHCYNTPMCNTVFGQRELPPVRQDTR